jgi:hypothetical protein
LTAALVRALVVIDLGFLGLVVLIYFKQHSMIYHPRPCDPSYAQTLPANGEEISYTAFWKADRVLYSCAQ